MRKYQDALVRLCHGVVVLAWLGVSGLAAHAATIDQGPRPQARGPQPPGTQAASTQAPGTQAPGPQAASTQAPGPQALATTDSAIYFYVLGRHLERADRIEEAIAAHKRAIELDPKSAELPAELSALYARQDNAVDAVAYAETALERDPLNEEANRILGMVYAAYAQQRQTIKRGDDPATYVARAIAAFEKARTHGGDPGLDLMLGRLYVQSAAFAKAIPLLTNIVRMQPESVEASELLATAQENAGQPAEAVATLQALLAGNPGSLRAQLHIADIYEREEQWVDAADALAKAQAMNAQRAPALSGRRAVALLSASRPAEAKTVVQNALASGRFDASDPILLYLLAESQRQLKELDAAQATLQKLIKAHPDDARGFHVLALVQQDKGDVGGAERTLRDLIARDPIDANALNSLGYMLAERGERLEEAVALVERALKIEPDNASYMDSLGWAYFQQGRIDKADPHLTEAAAKLTTSSVVQDHLGDLRFKQQRFTDAAAAWERALAGDGQSIDRSKIEKKLRAARGRM